MIRSKVALVRCESYDEEAVFAAVKKGVELIGGIDSILKKGEKVLLKPNNLASSKPDDAVTTHPSVFNAAARLMTEASFAVSYGDSPGFEKPAGSLAKSGFASVASRYGIPLADFEKGKTVDFPEGKVWKQFDIANACLEADAIVSLCKMKTHALARITGAVKNQFGCVYGLNKAAFHVKIPNPVQFSRMLVDLNRYLKPRLYIMDGIFAMEGNGPRSGTPVKMNCILVSRDPVAIDSTFCRMIDLDPSFIPTNTYGKQEGLGTWLEDEIELLGDPSEGFFHPDYDVVRKPLDNKIKKTNGFIANLIFPRPAIDGAKCIKCGICVEACPVEGKALNFRSGSKNEPPVYDYKKCIRCYCCQEMCPHKAIVIKKPFSKN
jgi:uncharacterized protein (DUF362 family)/ferredoxin